MAALVLVRFADETGAFLPAGALERFRTDVGLTYAEAGTVIVLIAPGSLLGTVATVAADVVSRRAIATAGAFGYAASLLLFAVGEGFLVLALGSLLLGAAATAMVDATEIAMVDVAGDDLPRYLARTNLFAVAGDLTGPALLAGVAAAGLSWRVAFVAAAALMVVYGLWLSTVPMPAPHPDPDDGGHRAAILSVVRDPAVWLLTAVALLMVPLDEPFLGFLIAFLERVRDLPSWAATLLAATTVSGGIVSFTAGPAFVQRLGDARALVAAAAALTATAGALVTLPHPLLLAPAGVAFGAALGVAWLTIQHRMLTIRPGRAGAVKAFVSTVEMVGFVIPVGIGAVADAHGLRAGLWLYTAVPAVMVAVALASARATPAASARRARR